MANPKIVYNPGSGNVTLTFSRPVRNVPSVDKRADRTDSISTAGVKQTILRRVDEFLTFDLDYVPLADMAAWSSFMDYALAGKSFDYYPDASQSAFTTYTLESTTFTAAYRAAGAVHFSLEFRKVVS
jgi:hypothetical protein